MKSRILFSDTALLDLQYHRKKVLHQQIAIINAPRAHTFFKNSSFNQPSSQLLHVVCNSDMCDFRAESSWVFVLSLDWQVSLQLCDN